MKKAVFIMLFAGNAYAVPSGVDTLNRTVGAAAAGMGGAYSTITDDTDCLFYNPACLAGLKTPELALTGQEGALEFLSAFAASYPLARGAVGVFAVNYDGRFRQDFIGGISYAAALSSSAAGLDAGIGVKAVESRYTGYNAALWTDPSPYPSGSGRAYCADVGVVYRMEPGASGRSRSKVALSARNLGGELAYDGGGKFPLVNSVRIGWSNESTVSHYSGHSYNTVTALDMVKYSGSDTLEACIGFGFKYLRYFTMRVGFRVFGADSEGGISLSFTLPLAYKEQKPAEDDEYGQMPEGPRDIKTGIQADYIELGGRLANTVRSALRIKWEK